MGPGAEDVRFILVLQTGQKKIRHVELVSTTHKTGERLTGNALYRCKYTAHTCPWDSDSNP